MARTAREEAVEILRQHGRMSGRELRRRLCEAGCKFSLAGFYQMMSRLEEEYAVFGEIEEQIVNGYSIIERQYRLGGF